jgi:tRNA-dihydrouridine synthase
MNTFWHTLPEPFFVLAPMEAVTDVVFRHVVAEAGAPDLWFSEFTNATGWVHAGQKAIGGRLLKEDDENPIVAQIWGGEPGDMAALAQHCKELGYDGIDINMGCPAKSAVKSGGSALIRKPELAAEAIAAAKTAGLPVSVKTRLGYTTTDEWRDWLSHLLYQDIVNLTIHLRTKKEMSKVPAHHELIPEIVALRDEIAPHTLLTINGDIEDREHGLELIAKYPGVNGIMIGRGIFHSPYCFRDTSPFPSSKILSESSRRSLHAGPVSRSAPSSLFVDEGAAPSPATHLEPDYEDVQESNEPTVSKPFLRGTTSEVQPVSSLAKTNEDTARNGTEKKMVARLGANDNSSQDLIGLLRFHLDLFDQYQPQLGRPFETLKRFFKIYIREFDGASELRHELMQTKSTDEVRALLASHGF